MLSPAGQVKPGSACPLKGAGRPRVAIADRAPGLELLVRSVNGMPGLVARHAGVVLTVAAFDVFEARVTRVRVVRNPDKLRPWVSE